MARNNRKELIARSRVPQNAITWQKSPQRAKAHHTKAHYRQKTRSQIGVKTTAPDLRKYRVSAPLRAFIWRWKYVSLALIAATAVHTLASVITSEGLGNVSVLVAKEEILVGETFNASNTAIRLYPENTVPTNSFQTIDHIDGKTAGATISRGLPITANQILDDAYLVNAPAGTVVTSITLRDDISAQLLQPGNHVELYAPAPEDGKPAKLLTSNAVIVGKPTEKAKNSMLGEVSDTTAVYVAVKKTDAHIILGLQTNTPLQAVIMNV